MKYRIDLMRYNGPLDYQKVLKPPLHHVDAADHLAPVKLRLRVGVENQRHNEGSSLKKVNGEPRTHNAGRACHQHSTAGPEPCVAYCHIFQGAPCRHKLFRATKSR